MGRANVYLSDDLERRVKAAQLPISEICQRALLAAVEAAESSSGLLDNALREQFQRGRAAGEIWAVNIEDGKILMMVDVPVSRVQEIEEMLHKNHPEAIDRGMEPTTPVFP